MITPNVIKGDNVAGVLSSALDAGQGLLRLTPTWVPRSFLHPGRRLKLHPDDLYAYGAERGGIDERWFASTTEAANEGRVWHEGLSFIGSRRTAFHADRRGGRSGSAADRPGHVGQVRTVAGVLEVLRQHGADSAPHASVAKRMPS